MLSHHLLWRNVWPLLWKRTNGIYDAYPVTPFMFIAALCWLMLQVAGLQLFLLLSCLSGIWSPILLFLELSLSLKKIFKVRRIMSLQKKTLLVFALLSHLSMSFEASNLCASEEDCVRTSACGRKALCALPFMNFTCCLFWFFCTAHTPYCFLLRNL